MVYVFISHAIADLPLAHLDQFIDLYKDEKDFSFGECVNQNGDVC
ncbi:Uncharacterised protein [Bordetella avium]|nr:Uncharacterised protein [Bordetella avium]